MSPGGVSQPIGYTLTGRFAQAAQFTKLQKPFYTILLDRLSNAIYLLKIQAQGQLEHYGIPISAVQDARADLAELLVTLQRSVHLLVESRGEEEMSLAFTGVATRFLQVNPGDVFDRLAELERVDQRLHDVAELPERDFRWLDNLQLLLEAEAAEGVHGLYRL